MSADGTGTPTKVSFGERPDWSPNGQKIAFDWNGDIWTVNADGTGATNLTQTDSSLGFETWPAFSPDGTQITFQVDLPGDSRFYLAVIGADGNGRRVLGPGQNPDWQPCPGPCPQAFGVPEVPRASSSVALRVRKRASSITARGRVTPWSGSQAVWATLFRRRSGKFTRVKRKWSYLSDDSRYAITFNRPPRGRCKLTVVYRGNNDHAPSQRSAVFSC